MFWAHDHAEPVGRWLDLKEDQTGLLATGKLTLSTRRGAEAKALMDDHALGLSIGFILAKDGAKEVGGVRYITKIGRLAEISPVALPANHNARILPRPESRREFEHLLRKVAGLSAREAKRAVTAVRNEHSTNQEQKLDLVLEQNAEILKHMRTR